jgi:hypothetical protein
MLVIIAIDHLPNPVREFTYEFLGFVSAAEGFVFLSGYVAGLVYTRTAVESGQHALWKRALKRAGRIYLYHTAIFVSLWAAISLGLLKAGVFAAWVPGFFENPSLALLLGVALLYQPRLLDILPMYCVFILATPLAIRMLVPAYQGHKADEDNGARTVPVRSGHEPVECLPLVPGFSAHGRAASRDGSRSGTSKLRPAAVLLALSIGVWVCAQLGVRNAVAHALLPGLPLDLGDFDPLAWQLLFLAGLWLGFRRQAGIASQPSRLPTGNGRTERIIFLCAYILAVILFALRQDLLWPATSTRLWPFAAKTELGPLRLLNFAVVAFVITHKLLWPANAPWLRWLAYLGRHSLQVFAFNIVCVYLLRGLLDPWEQRSGWIQASALLLCVLTLPLPAWLHENYTRLTTKHAAGRSRR